VTRLRATFGDKLSDAERARAKERCVEALVAAGCGVREVRSSGGSLEDVFTQLTRGEADGGKADS
jgi:hypothetical protein